jgi:enediyne biosynthesis protein E4
MLPLVLAGCRGGTLGGPAPVDARGEAARVAAPAPRFTDITAAAGLRWRHSNGARGLKRFPETMGGGGGFVDVDGDGWIDLVLIDSVPPAGGSTVTLLRNRPGPVGARRFSDETTRSGLRSRFYGMGLAVGDVDNDGDLDLYVTALGPNRLFLNDGRGRFTDATARAGVGDPRYSTSAAFLDYDRDGDLDLFVCNYLRWDAKTELPCFAGDRVRIYCPPTRYPGARSTLYRNEGGGRFRDVTTAAGIRNPAGKSLGVAVYDLNRDGRPDLYVANDLEPNCAFIQGADGRFSDQAPELGIAVSPAGRARAGMGVDARPRGPEGPALLAGNYQTEGAALFVPVPGGFEERTEAAGLLKPTLNSLTFGLGLLDLNLDSELDVVLLNGHVEPDIARYQPGQRYRQRPQLFVGTPGGAFTDVSDRAGEPFQRGYAGRALAWGDIDNDGDLDLLAVENNGPAHLWRNDAAGAHWLTVACDGCSAAPGGYGTTVEVRAGGRTQVQTVRSGSSYLAAHDPRLSFGLGSAARVEALTVRWPDGRVDRQTDLAVDRIVRVRR